MTHLVFLPGLHGDAQTWAPVMRALPERVTVTALDLPAVPDLDALADEVAEQVEQVEQGSVVVGHSLGGVVAMHLAERYPTILAGLVLVTAPVGAEDPESAKARADRAAGLSPEAYEEIALDGMEAVYYGDRGHDPEVRAERLRAARVYGPERFAAHSVAIGARPDRSEFPAQAGVPVLIVGASDDLVVPTEEQRRWVEANGAGSSGAGTGAGAGANGDAGGPVTYVEIPETGHMLPVEAPDELAGAIVDWLRGLSG
ncbi:alpha/beta hydrolase [Dietzia maris]|uniref:alpha/beta fold hydrolase n=1 Tax=Dietzia maris TaxID=37915 RepID=UPI0022B52B1D|nr:alpha/beta hydrolase [Dietzia maris]MCZ4541666.1 alpha/beta hydrolase [Dietzia maris]